MNKEQEEKLNKARKVFKERENDLGLHEKFKELERVFFEVATDDMKKRFWNAPVYDRPNVIEGKTQKQMDSEWNELVS